MNNSIQTVFDMLEPIYEATDEALNEWNSSSNLEFPTLMSMVASKMNWSEKQIKSNDPQIRFYVKNHPEWTITRGMKGGCCRRSVMQKKEEERAAKLAAKEQLKAAIEAKVAAATPVNIITSVAAKQVENVEQINSFIDLEEEDNSED